MNGPHDPVETTGEIIMSFGPDGPAITAPARAAIPETELFGLDRVHHENGVYVLLPGGVRYRIGARHRRWSGVRYLHRQP